MVRQKVSFYEWSEIVCGNYRLASETELRLRWDRDWLPQQAIEDLQRRKLFKRRYRRDVPFWQVWNSSSQPLKKRRRAMSRLDMQCRLARVMIEEVRALSGHRLQPADRRWLQDLVASCRITLRKKDEELRARKAAKTAPTLEAIQPIGGEAADD